MSGILAFVVFEFSDTLPNNLALVAIYKDESDADTFITNHTNTSLVKRQMMFTDEQVVMLQTTARFVLPMNL